ncbi:RES family NAD+ phosphorylase [Reichenbachiella carrageenanivorans]|uniref:RES family NAD+ phosphorylase n=1 Tax=Reichenbachiella carrageenanivorans TaxID=2979869 RepID=A0ABY6CZN3_9BACT|nr:RES family NAD+ phosphorylase [Reichenbachiella carrageenanivorans]UXX79347.1 RES family NAD+ phosphorylase [Reichenbachiella carrageenanivorans]
MIVYRICHEKFANQLNSSGRPNRWNTHAQHVIYTSGSISLCALELLAHTSGIRPAGTFRIMHIAVDDKAEMMEISEQILPTDWQGLATYPITQQLGSTWYQSKKSLILKIPSAIIPQESNYILNTDHPDFLSHVRIDKVTDFIWDHRFPEN